MNVCESERPVTGNTPPRLTGEGEGRADGAVSNELPFSIRQANTLRSLALSIGCVENLRSVEAGQALRSRMTAITPLEQPTHEQLASPRSTSASKPDVVRPLNSKGDDKALPEFIRQRHRLEREVLQQCNCSDALIEFARTRSSAADKCLSNYLIKSGFLDAAIFYWGISGRMNVRYAPDGSLSAIAPIADKLKPFETEGIVFVPALDLNQKVVFAAAPLGHQLEAFERVLDYVDEATAKIVVVTPHYQKALAVTTASANALVQDNVSMSAVHRFVPSQRKLLTVSPLVLLGAAGFAFDIFFWALIALLTLSLGAIGLLRLASFFTYSDREKLAIPKLETWPHYTVLVPLYKESAVCSQLVEALDALDYPKEALTIIFLVEQDDTVTQKSLRKLLKKSMQIMILPPGKPQTKPRALSAGLAVTRGEFLTVFDAEDRPEPQQLKKAICQFAFEGHEVACLQASLSIDHASQGWLVRQFAFEYAALFDVFLPFLSRKNLLLPLGGTSNHFRVSALRKVGGWDPFNVTEDADLAVRFARQGFKTRTLNSSTYEEAPLTLKAWLHQRTRWHKGWIQTLAVHLRSPATTYKQLGLKNFSFLLLTFLGGMLCLWAAPLTVVMLGNVLLDLYLTGGQTLDAFSIYAGFCFLFGLGGTVVTVLQGSAKRGFRPRIWEIASIPVYWVLGCIASYQALIEFFIKPHHWRKTEHGIVRHRAKVTAQSEA
ncbi:Beta-monoglucosyldiacylglycerol synthase [Pseudovibrio axinellae]|uniref:Beta-monoglucosyldiacylglycerol synthase n=1 Tax=Pseudovibrio axinellae TaxID=989403 RepID=A0A165YJG6_9HYPH|nr:glycosyltransferase [Pseudovibrio axinellae]KZL18895.1 Beta-monoglucosyldiacylglycerol synthase [Pseudovibrio axinellae]SEP88646.1 Glycosyltransferase, catalytic subunit of cellulose synthase and poly-beta-1,6-N-acetylglucosamine synthase [Pseudovibrio axinellae]